MQQPKLLTLTVTVLDASTLSAWVKSALRCHQLNRRRSQLKPPSKPPSENEKLQLRIKPKERRCGTFVLRQGLDALSEIERVKFFKEMEELGLPPVI